MVDSDFVIVTVLQGARDTQETFETIEGSVEAWQSVANNFSDERI